MTSFEFSVCRTEHEEAIASRCGERIRVIEERIAELVSILDTSETQRAEGDIRVEMEMAQSELEFWRAKYAGAGGTERQAGRDGYMLVPARPSARALNLAHGYTDLVDISCSPRDMHATREEIALAIRIANETDGVRILAGGGISLAAEEVPDDMRLEAHKEIQHRLSSVEEELIKTSARYAELREKLDWVADGRATVERVIDMERSLDAGFGCAGRHEGGGPAVAAWRKLLADAAKV